MSNTVVFNSVAEATEFYIGAKPDHPLVHVIDLSQTAIGEKFLNTKVCSNLYSISLKDGICGQIRYGRQHYDFSSGVLTAFGPGQVVEVNETYELGALQGWFIMFHPDLFIRHSLNREIKQLGYFSYDVCEALHLSEKEQITLNKLINDITHETKQNHDQFSQDIILASIDLVLKYVDRFFNRQFLTRKTFNMDCVEQFIALVEQHLSNAEIHEAGLPTVNQLADALNMTPSYLSDLLKSQTGKTAQELIHHQLIDKAKYMLLNSEDSVATIAYKLGFEYPQYFSRIFKKKTSLTPVEFRKVN